MCIKCANNWYLEPSCLDPTISSPEKKIELFMKNQIYIIQYKISELKETLKFLTKKYEKIHKEWLICSWLGERSKKNYDILPIIRIINDFVSLKKEFNNICYEINPFFDFNSYIYKYQTKIITNLEILPLKLEYEEFRSGYYYPTNLYPTSIKILSRDLCKEIKNYSLNSMISKSLEKKILILMAPRKTILTFFLSYFISTKYWSDIEKNEFLNLIWKLSFKLSFIEYETSQFKDLLFKKENDPSKPNALLFVIPLKGDCSDDNGAIKDSIPLILNHILILNCNLDVRFPISIKYINDALTEKIYNYVFFTAHGDPNRILFLKNFILYKEDIPKLNFSMLAENAKIYINSCRTGALGGIGEQIARYSGKIVFAPKIRGHYFLKESEIRKIFPKKLPPEKKIYHTERIQIIFAKICFGITFIFISLLISKYLSQR